MISELKKNRAAAAVIVLALLATVMVIPFSSQSGDADPGDIPSNPYIVSMTKGQTWKYDTTFTPSLDPTVTISKQGGSFSATDGTYATVAGRTVTVAIPSDAPVNEYYIVIRAETTNPHQSVNQFVKFTIKDVLSLDAPASQIAVVGKPFSWTPTTNASSIGGAAWTVIPALPAGLSIDASTGRISGVPAAASAASDYTVRVSTSGPVQMKSVTLNLTVQAALEISAPTVYAAEGGPQDLAWITTNLSGAKTFQVTSYGTLVNGAAKLEIDPDGVIHISPVSGDAGTYTITVRVTMADSGQTAETTFQLVVSERLEYTSSPSAGYIIEG